MTTTTANSNFNCSKCVSWITRTLTTDNVHCPCPPGLTMQFEYIMEFGTETRRRIYFNSSVPRYTSFLEMSTDRNNEVRFSINYEATEATEALPGPANETIFIRGDYSLFQVDIGRRLNHKTGQLCLNGPGVHEFGVIWKPEFLTRKLSCGRLIVYEFEWCETIVNKL